MSSQPKVVRPISRKKLLELETELSHRGVCYLGRIPPHMQPQKLRHLLSEYGEVIRLYLTPEDAAITKRRNKSKKTRKHFTEGWVEFADSKIAKAAALTLNNTIIGGKKGDMYHDDIWNIKYLKGFQWNQLTEQIAYENAVRDSKLRNELQQVTRENEFILKKVNEAKAWEHIKEKKEKKSLKETSIDNKTEVQSENVASVKKRKLEDSSETEVHKRNFKQKQSKKDFGQDVNNNLLSKIMAK